MRFLRIFSAVLLGLFFVLPARAQAPERVASVEGITEYRLRNGFRVLLFPDPSKSTMTVNITYLVGSKHENYGETGMAHLLEHLLFKGSPRHPNIPKELQDHGSRPNGTTWYDRTNYFETFQATDANLEWALDLEADRMMNSYVAQKDLNSEMTVVRNEFEAGENSAPRVLADRVLSTAYLWHNYGKSTIGARSDIENVMIDRLQAFYKKYYQPDNAILLVAGKIDQPKTLALIQKYFGPIPRPQRKLEQPYTAEPVQDGERSVVLRRVGDIQAIVAAYHVPAGSHQDFAALEVASQVLRDTPSGRLYKALVESKKASSVSGFNFQLREPGVGFFTAEVRKESSIEDARDTLLATIDSIKTNPLTVQEIDRARNRLLKDIEILLGNSERVGLTISEWAAMGDWRLLFLNRDRIRQVSAEEVQRAATYYFKPDNRTVGLFIPTNRPERVEIPASPDVEVLLKDYKGQAPASMGEAFDASPENIDRRTQRSTLPGGMKLAFLPKETRGDVVSAILRLQFGDEQSLKGRALAGRMTAQMLMRGTAERSRQEIQDDLDRLKARLNVAGTAANVTATIETVRANLPAVLELAAEVVRQPAFPQAEFETLRQQMLATLESQKAEPDTVALRAFQRHLNPYPKGDLRHVAAFDEEIADLRALTLDQLKSFHTDFYGASASELAIVGDFEASEVERIVISKFDGWKSPKPYAQVRNPYRKIDPVNQAFETPDKANAFFVAGLRINIRDEDPEYPALLFANYMIGQGMNSRLFARIRGREGLSYGIGSSLSVQPLEDSAPFMATAIAAPENAAKVEASFKDEIATILRDGFTDAEIAAAKIGWMQAQQVSRAQDRELVNRLGLHTHFGRTMAWDAGIQQKVQALTNRQIVTALQKHLDPAAMTFMKGGHFNKAGVKP